MNKKWLSKALAEEIKINKKNAKYIYIFFQHFECSKIFNNAIIQHWLEAGEIDLNQLRNN